MGAELKVQKRKLVKSKNHLGITYLAFSIPDSMSFGFVITPILHAYFDIFDGLIQMAVFTMLTMVNVAQEAPSKEEERAIEQLA